MPEDANQAESVGKLRQIAPEVMVVVAFGQKLSRQLLEVPGLGCVNLHASLLPRYRGAAPVHWAIIQGETTTGVTVIRMREEIDAGEILAQEATPIGGEESAGELGARLAKLGAKLLCSVLDQLAAGSITGQPQDRSQVSYAPKIKKLDTLIDWDQTPDRLHNFIRGLSPRPGPYTWLEVPGGAPVRMIILGSRQLPGGIADVPPGKAEVDARGIVVSCRQGKLLITEVKPAGGRQMSAAEYLKGHPLAPEAMFLSRNPT